VAETIEFQGAVYKVSTLCDGGIRLTLDLPETAIAAAAMLMECQRQGVVLNVSAEPEGSGLNRKKSHART